MVQNKLVPRLHVHIWSAQASASLDCTASSQRLLRRNRGNLLWQHSDANVTQLVFDRLFREEEGVRWHYLWVCDNVSASTAMTWQGAETEGWMKIKGGKDGMSKLCSKMRQQLGNCFQPTGSMQFIWCSEKWQLIIQPIPWACLCYPTSLEKTDLPIHQEKGRGVKKNDR